MAEPKKRLTSTRSGHRRSHLALKATSLSICSQCKSPVLGHRVCPACGFYKSRDILELERIAREKEERRKKKEEKNE